MIEMQPGYKMLTFDMKMPFDLVGFIAHVSSSLAIEGIPIFLISSYSTDHMLVKKEYLGKAVSKLRSMGFEVKT